MNARVGVKICGVTEVAALVTAAERGASRIGFVFFPPSPRNLPTEQARALSSRVPIGLDRVGVFVEPTDDFVDSVTRQVPLDAIQLHGEETPERVAAIRARAGVQVIKAIGVERQEDLATAPTYEAVCDWLMFDTKAPADAPRPGGMGAAFDWRLLAGCAWRRPWILSGGLTPTNVAQAIEVTGARHVDVSSGVESAPGVKDTALIRRFLDAVATVAIGESGSRSGA